jgi:hypothetical protein
MEGVKIAAKIIFALQLLCTSTEIINLNTEHHLAAIANRIKIYNITVKELMVSQ